MPDIKNNTYSRAINDFDLFELDTRANLLIKEYRQELGLSTPNNRIDTGDLRQIVLALFDMGFHVVKKEEDNG